MNVILFHSGKYNEKLNNYKLLYKKCFESIKKEFKDDNIIIFYSVEDVFEKYPNVKKLIEEKYLSFWNKPGANDWIRYDLIRSLLIKEIDDLLYIDSDIFVEKGFRQEIINRVSNNPSKVLFFIKNSMGCFYSKYDSKCIDIYLPRFTKKLYNGYLRNRRVWTKKSS